MKGHSVTAHLQQLGKELEVSREIDLSKRLSDEDAEYLMARGREQEVVANRAQFTDDEEARRLASYVPGTSVDTAEGVPVTKGGDPLVNNGGGTTDGMPVFANAANLAIDGEAGDAGVGALLVGNEDDEEDGDTEDNYESWSKRQLKEELESRNSERSEDDQLSVSGDKATLVARLREDDAEDEEDTDAS